MSRLLFAPFGLVGGMLAGAIGKRVFARLWGIFDDQQAPEPGQRRVSPMKLALALALEGAIFRMIRGLFDHGSRRMFETATGNWPGGEAPDPE